MSEHETRAGDAKRLARLQETFRGMQDVAPFSGIVFLLRLIDSRDADLREALAKIEELAQILAIQSMKEAERIYIDNALPEGWLWTIRKFRNNPWSDCGYAEAHSPHEEPAYKTYGHTPSEAFRELVRQVLTDRSPKAKS